MTPAPALSVAQVLTLCSRLCSLKRSPVLLAFFIWEEIPHKDKYAPIFTQMLLLLSVPELEFTPIPCSCFLNLPFLSTLGARAYKAFG